MLLDLVLHDEPVLEQPLQQTANRLDKRQTLVLHGGVPVTEVVQAGGETTGEITNKEIDIHQHGGVPSQRWYRLGKQRAK